MKKLMKRLLPPVIVNNIHKQLNRMRINTIDKILFPECIFSQSEFEINYDAYPFNGVVFELSRMPERLKQQINIWQNWTQDEYLLIYEKPCLIEPRSGWAITSDNHLIYPSLGFSRVDYLRKPSLKALQMRSKPVQEYTELISLRDTGEENYYHFYNDILTKLFFLEEKLGVGTDVPILIAAALYNRAYFQYFLQHPYLRDRTWIIQSTQYVRSHKTYFCKPLTHTFGYYARIQAMAQPFDVAYTGAERSIFITRSSKRLRHIENGTEIELLCREAGLEIVDFDELTLPKQIQTLANARYVVGIHGAGLVNMLFRAGRPMSLLEIFPPGEYYPFHYMLMARQLDYWYDGMIGKPANKAYSGGFYVEPIELRQRIETLLAA